MSTNDEQRRWTLQFIPHMPGRAFVGGPVPDPPDAVVTVVAEADEESRVAGFQSFQVVPLTINGMPAVDFIRCAYDLGTDLNGLGRFDMHDPIQAELRRIKDWITMAEHDALGARSEGVSGGGEH